jgi:tetratricopeptide (TPR) repeat protein
MIQTFWRYVTVALLALAACVASLSSELTYDDVRAGRTMKAARSFWDFDAWARQDAPLRQMSLFLDSRIWRADTLAYHAANVAFHAVTALVFLALFRRMLAARMADAAQAEPARTAMWAAGLFAVLPINAAAAGVVAHRNEMFGAWLLLGALWAWLRPERRAVAWVVGALCALLASLETRMALVLPFVVMAYDLWLSSARRARRVPAAIVLAAAIAIVIVAVQTVFRWWVEEHGYATLESWETAPAWAEWPMRLLRDWPAGVLTAVRLAVAPFPFNMDHGVTPASWVEAMGGWVIIYGLVAAIYRAAGRSPFLAFGLTWLLAAAGVAALNVFRHRYGAILEQQLYGVTFGIALVIGRAIERLCRFKPGSARFWIEAGALALVALALIGWGNWRAINWGAQHRLLETTLQNNHASGLARLALGRLHLQADRVQQAEQQFLLAAAANWNYYETYGNLGETALAKKDYPRAEKLYRQALEMNPGSYGARFHLGHALFGQKRYAEAREAYQQVLPKSPRYAALYKVIGDTYAAEKRMDEAGHAYEQARRLNEEARKARAAARGGTEEAPRPAAPPAK